jgi:hypothetical protein
VDQTLFEKGQFAPFTVLDSWIYALDGNGLSRLSVEGGNPETFGALRYCDTMRHSGTALYCAKGLGVVRISLDSRAESVIGESFGYGAQGLVVDQTSVYWIAGGDLRRVAQTGGASEVLVSGFFVEGHPAGYFVSGDLAGDKDSLYVTSSDEILLRVPKNGSVPIALGTAATRELEVFGDYLYWAGNFGAAPTVMATPLRHAGPDVVVARSKDQVNGLTVSAAGVFWSTRGEDEVDAQGRIIASGAGAIYAAYWSE